MRHAATRFPALCADNLHLHLALSSLRCFVCVGWSLQLLQLWFYDTHEKRATKLQCVVSPRGYRTVKSASTITRVPLYKT